MYIYKALLASDLLLFVGLYKFGAFPRLPSIISGVKPRDSLPAMPSLLQTFVETQIAGRSAKGAYKPQQGETETPVGIIDIRRDTAKANLKEEIYRLFHSQEGPRKLPTLLLYDEKGLQLFEKVGRPLPSAWRQWQTDRVSDHVFGRILLDQCRD